MTAEVGRIVRDSGIRFGKPCIRGTRVAVSAVLRWLGSGMSADEILAAYPHLIREGLHAALRHAAKAPWVLKRAAPWRFLLNEDVSPVVAQALTDPRHDVAMISDSSGSPSIRRRFS